MQGAECPPPRLLTGKFLLMYQGKKRQGKKGKGVKTENVRKCWKENCKKMEVGKVTKKEVRTFFFFFFFFFFLPGKSISRQEKKPEK